MLVGDKVSFVAPRGGARRKRRRTVGKAKVLKVDIGARVELPRRLDKSVDELVVLLTADSLLSEPEVQVVLQQLLVIRATVENDGQGPVGVDAGAERRENELGYRDQDASAALVANAEDLLAVCEAV